MQSLTEPAHKASKPTKRLVCIASALDMNPETFFPTSFDANFALSPTLRSLELLRKDFTVFSHMDPPNIYTKHGSMNSLLSGVDAKKATAGENVSMDQVAAAHFGYQTRFPSMHVSLGGSQGASWTASGIKVREETDPLNLFRKLFVDAPKAATEDRKLELNQQGSVLNLVRSQAKRLEHDINAADRQKLEEYLTAIRETEERIQGMQHWYLKISIHPPSGRGESEFSGRGGAADEKERTEAASGIHHVMKFTLPKTSITYSRASR